MKFDLLPNEILVECFEYFNAYELFESFDGLNVRLSQLIRTIPLHVNFYSIQKQQFERFCSLLKSNSNLQTQIYSLTISNRNTPDQINLFLSQFNEFPHLRSLTLIDLEESNIECLTSILPSLNQLQSFVSSHNELVDLIPLTNLRRLNIRSFALQNTSNLTHLTITSCSFDQILCEIFRVAPLLKYLHAKSIYNSSKHNQTKEYYRGEHLSRLIIDNINCTFDEFECVIRLLPNLESLKLTAFENASLTNANHWECLIRNVLHNLKSFQFIFGSYCRGSLRDVTIKQLKCFQTPFWFDEHQWFTECVVDTHSVVIYTVPYADNVYRLTLSTEKYSNMPNGNRLHTFDRVSDLTVCSNIIEEQSPRDFFANITQLKLDRSNSHQLTYDYVQLLKEFLSFNHVKHLDISAYDTIELSAVKDIFQLAPKLFSLTFHPSIWLMLSDDEQLCEYFTRQITVLNVSLNQIDVKQLCRVFANLEQLISSINELDQLKFLLNNTKKLSIIQLEFPASNKSNEILTWFEEQTSNYPLTYRLLYESRLYIWRSFFS